MFAAIMAGIRMLGPALLNIGKIGGNVAPKLFNIAKGLTSVGSSAMNLVSNLMKQASQALTNVSGNAVGKPVKMGMQASGMGTYTSMLKAATEAPIQMLNSLKSALNPIAELVSKINPGLVQQFTMAMDDLSGVLGEILLPVFQQGIEMVRFFGDTLKTLKPVFDVFYGIFIKIVNEFKKLIRPLLDIFVALAPILFFIAKLSLFCIQVLIPIISFLLKIIKYLVWALVGFTNALIFLLKVISLGAIKLNYLKMIDYGDLKPKKALGTSIREVSRVSALSIGELTREKALGQSINYPKETLDEMKKGKKAVEDIKNLLETSLS